jgi:hypothetical protein
MSAEVFCGGIREEEWVWLERIERKEVTDFYHDKQGYLKVTRRMNYRRLARQR